MKTIHKRFYTVLPRPAAVASSSASTSQLPRVRSNSASSSRSLYTSSHLSFLDGPTPPPPPPSTRGNSNVVIGTRLAAEARGEIEGHTNHPSSQGQNGHLPYPIALTLGQSEVSSHLPLSPYNPFLPYQSLSPLLVYSAKSAEAPAPDHRKKRQRTRYQLDVGAYGIPKRSKGYCVAGRDGHGRFAPGEVRSESHQELGRAVQVGEDAYFVRDNAMGVADGVGGWSRLRKTATGAEPSPSALFARRLMHYCSEEVDAASEQPEQGLAGADPYSDAEDDIYAELEDSLEELEDGLDVLMILEKAYEKTLRSHVCRADQSAPSSRSRSLSPSDSHPETTLSSHEQSPSAALPEAQETRATEAHADVVPLFEGSSTALVAILEHPSSRSFKSFKDAALFDPQPASAKHGVKEEQTGGAIIRIAHLGDCMGMLIRGEEIVWRTEEMWWSFNTPVQLGPSSTTKPHDARVFTVPVQQDDILILASDGLSDNLWDRDILDEVVRFRRSFMTTKFSDADDQGTPAPASTAFRRSTLAGMLSEALCSRAKRVSETRGARGSASSKAQKANPAGGVQVEFEVPFARRAREQGRLFDGGKPDDISVLVAVISPVEP
ncbi:phosphatase 2C-like domain-containing protein [Trametes elegans]|nr:phosphatase 2C-like domain-containing protein [Trametes elegans]